MSDNITQLLIRWNQGDGAALEGLVPLIYRDLHRLAANYLRGERPEHTLQATALVHEAYLQVRGLDRIEWKNRAHFIGMTAQIMRRILLEHAERRHAAKRGGDRLQVSADPDQFSNAPDLTLMALDEALEKLSQEHPRQARVVELRFFGGLSSEEAADVLSASGGEVSLRTVERDWRFARAWLHGALVSV